ncbi:MAG: hypothetical protein ACRDRX_05680 [Pseudonocardiaceae bacterium]
MSDPDAPGPAPGTDPLSGPPRGNQRRVLMTTCQAHGAAGFTNLLVTKEGGFIVLNPHLANCCVLRLDEQVATALYRLLGEWLGYEPLDD